jgi:hypothetical protein
VREKRIDDAHQSQHYLRRGHRVVLRESSEVRLTGARQPKYLAEDLELYMRRIGLLFLGVILPGSLTMLSASEMSGTFNMSGTVTATATTITSIGVVFLTVRLLMTPAYSADASPSDPAETSEPYVLSN